MEAKTNMHSKAATEISYDSRNSWTSASNYANQMRWIRQTPIRHVSPSPSDLSHAFRLSFQDFSDIFFIPDSLLFVCEEKNYTHEQIYKYFTCKFLWCVTLTFRSPNIYSTVRRNKVWRRCFFYTLREKPIQTTHM